MHEGTYFLFLFSSFFTKHTHTLTPSFFQEERRGALQNRYRGNVELISSAISLCHLRIGIFKIPLALSDLLPCSLPFVSTSLASLFSFFSFFFFTGPLISLRAQNEKEQRSFSLLLLFFGPYSLPRITKHLTWKKKKASHMLQLVMPSRAITSTTRV